MIWDYLTSDYMDGVTDMILLWCLWGIARDYWWNPRRLGPHILKAEPRIRQIIESVDDHTLTPKKVSRAVNSHLSGIDDTATVIKLTSTLLMVARHAGMSRTEVMDMFLPSDRELRERNEL
jgi:hypothetical protein